MCVMGANQEEDDWDGHEIFLGWCILVAIIDLLPHVEIVKGTGIKVERNASYPVEHDI